MSRRFMLAVAIALLSLAGAIIIWTLFRTNTGWAYDMAVYRMGASIVLNGGDLYASSTPHPYTYPPFSAMLFIPLAVLPIDAGSILWTALSVAALIVAIWTSIKYLTHLTTRPLWGRVGVGALTVIIFLAAVLLDPIADTLLAGQVNLFVMALVLTDLLLPDSNRWKGVATGFAATFKILPLFFLVYLLATRRLAAALRAGVTFLVTVAVAFIVLPRDSIAYWGGSFLNSSRVGDAQNPRSESLLSLLVRWAHTTNVRPLWLALALIVAVLVLAFAVWAHRRGDEFAAICITASGTLLLSPITWRHHWVWVLPMLMWMIRRAQQLAWLWIPIGLIALDFYLRPYGAIPINPLNDLHLDFSQLVLSSTHPLSLLLFLVSAFVILRSLTVRDSSSTTRRRRQAEPEARPAGT